MRSVLIIAAKANMIQQFNLRNIELLISMGFKVHVGSNFEEFGSMDKQTRDDLLAWLASRNVEVHQLPFGRQTGSIQSNYQTIKAIRMIVSDGQEWAFLHVHSPIGAALGRIAVFLKRIPVIYTAHGFHFFKGGPKKNWLFFPIEWILGLMTRELIVINQNDLKIAKVLPIRNVTYLPSIGADVEIALEQLPELIERDRYTIRKELGFTMDDFIMLNVGELNDNKNQMLGLRALKVLNSNDIKFVIAGVGGNSQEYLDFANSEEIASRVKLLGYRSDLTKLYHAVDVLFFPSIREGFGMGAFDALINGVYVIGSQNTGVADYIIDASLGRLIDPRSLDEAVSTIEEVYNSRLKPDLKRNKQFLLQFDKKNVDSIMKSVYMKYR